jgi:Family of unknown function (DUF6111)
MVRVFVTIVLPLLLPTALYLIWMSTLGAPHESAAIPWTSVPWVWLAGAGAVLLAIVLLVVTVGFGTPQQGVYVAPRWQNGRIIPGHLEPKAPR